MQSTITTQYHAVADTFVSVARHGSRWGCYMQDEETKEYAWIGEWSSTKAAAIDYARANYPLPAYLVSVALFARQAARDARQAQEDYYTAPGFHHARYAELVDAKKLADSEWNLAMERVDANSEAADLYQEAVNPPPAPTPGAPLAAPTIQKAGETYTITAYHETAGQRSWSVCLACDTRLERDRPGQYVTATTSNGVAHSYVLCLDCIPDPQTHAAREAAQRADEAELHCSCRLCPTCAEQPQHGHRCPTCHHYYICDRPLCSDAEGAEVPCTPCAYYPKHGARADEAELLVLDSLPHLPTVSTHPNGIIGAIVEYLDPALYAERFPVDDEAHSYAAWATPTLAQRIALALEGRLPAMAGGSEDDVPPCKPQRHRLLPKGDRATCLDCGAAAVRLIGAGWAMTTPAGDVKPGQRWVFNYGTTYDVLKVERDGLWVNITARDRKSGTEYTQRKRATTPIVAMGHPIMAGGAPTPADDPAGPGATVEASAPATTPRVLRCCCEWGGDCAENGHACANCPYEGREHCSIVLSEE